VACVGQICDFLVIPNRLMAGIWKVLSSRPRSVQLADPCGAGWSLGCRRQFFRRRLSWRFSAKFFLDSRGFKDRPTPVTLVLSLDWLQSYPDTPRLLMNKPSLLIIFLTVFIDLIGFGIVMPLLPRYTEQFGAQGDQIGLVISSFSVMQLFFAPLWGRLSDRIGRRPVLLISNAGSAISYGLFAVASSMEGSSGLWMLLASRVFAGVCGANISVASAYIADITTPENRSKGMGMIGMAFGLGFILGPAIGALAAWSGPSTPGWVAAAFCGANFLLGCFILVESRKPGQTTPVVRPKLSQLRHTVGLPGMAPLLLVFFLATFCFTCFETTLPLLLGSTKFHSHNLRDASGLLRTLRESNDPVSKHVRALSAQGGAPLPEAPTEREQIVSALNRVIEMPDFPDPVVFPSLAGRDSKEASGGMEGGVDLHLNRLLLQKAYPDVLAAPRFYFDETRIGFLFAFCGLMAAMVQGGAIGRLVKRFGERRLIIFSLAGVSLSLLMIPMAGGLFGLLLGLGLFSIASGITRAPTMGLISATSPAEEQGASLGVAQSVGALARILGPIFASALYGRAATLPYFVCAGIALAASCIAYMRIRR